MVKLTVEKAWEPPQWAVMERLLFDTLGRAAAEFVNRYVRADGTLVWREDWPGMDGSDDPYEGFMYLPLLYALGGGDELLEMGHRIWDGITWQWTSYGQISREFDAYYDWMHHGEGYLFHYFLGLADPHHGRTAQRAMRFAAMYTGDDPEAPNYDPEKKLIRSPINGSKGPRFQMTEEDWCTHRGILDHYPAPFEDIPGVDYASGTCPWSDDAVYKEILSLMNRRMAKGDVPLNLNATGMVANAYMHSGDDRLLDWVTGYVAAWRDRAARNGGIMPDNIGLNGEIGENMDGKWWGGYYGWRWPHGFITVFEPLLNAAANAVLLTGDADWLSAAREQLDRNWELRRQEGGRWKVPYKHTDQGWTDFREADPLYPIHLWFVSMADEDIRRIERTGLDESALAARIPGVSGTDPAVNKSTKHYNANTLPWFRYIRGDNPDYPERILAANFELIRRQLAKLRSPEGDPASWTFAGYNEDDFSHIHIWQEMCPVYFEGLLQLVWGAPMHISHGGLQHASVRYYDALRRRPGLPEDVAALVESVSSGTIALQLVNLSLFARREVIVQAGAFGEHRIDAVTGFDQAGREAASMPVGDSRLSVELAPGAGIRLELAVTRYANRPSYASVWPARQPSGSFRGRTASP